MFVLDFFSWWYGSGWAGVISRTRQHLTTLARMFSTKTLLRTLFAPWRRIMTAPGAGLDAHFRAIIDNFVSRCIGFVIRLFVLIAALLSLVFLALAGIVQLIVWPLLPVGSVMLIIVGLA